MSTKSKLERITLHPCGEVGPWEFHDGLFCGQAQDSLGLSRPSYFNGRLGSVGLAFTREDATKLREFIQTCEARWAKEQRAYEDD